MKVFPDILEIGVASVYAAARCLMPPGRVVLFYHSVTDQERRLFQRQMEYLADKCRVVKPSEIRRAPQQPGKTTVAITFDDAFVSVIENALPALQKYSLPAAVCVPTANLGERPRWHVAHDCRDSQERVMDERQIRQLDRDGFELFSHGAAHVPLAEACETLLSSELLGSKERLEQILGHEVVGISYPHGSWNDRVAASAARAGYRFGFTVEPLFADVSRDDLTIGRVSVSPADDLYTFRLKAAGAYQAVGRARILKRRVARLVCGREP